MRPALSANDREVIRARHYGSEKATPSLLAAIFGVSVQKITAVLRTNLNAPLRQPSQMEI